MNEGRCKVRSTKSLSRVKEASSNVDRGQVTMCTRPVNDVMLIHAQARSRVINTTCIREHQLACLSETISVRQRRRNDAYPDVNDPGITFYRSLLLNFFG
jgi:hypothetical protein